MNQDSKTFCILPFVHLYSEPKGELKPCCIAGGFDDPVSLKNLSIEDAFNSPQMKELRKDMLEGKRNKVCDVCYKKEDLNNHSPRLMFNNNTLWEMPKVNEDFSVEPNFQHVDVRFSNLCNFKCRMCTFEFSSNWYEDIKKLHPSSLIDTPKVLRISENIVEDLKPHLKNLKSIYFAGGEPLIMPEHFELLKFLYENTPISDDLKLRRLSIHYNTNLSVIKYDEKSLLDFWKGFTRVLLSISCDGIGKVGEYQRVGFNHDNFVKNLNNIKKYFEPTKVSDLFIGCRYNFQYTTTIYNVYHIFDFIDFMMENEYITETSQIDFYYAWGPEVISLKNITDVEKSRVIEFLNNGLIVNQLDDKTVNEIKSLINFINLPQSITPNQMYDYVYQLDYFNNTSYKDIGGIHFDSMLKKSLI
jgi:MoaA/NifB/PqqE/SkfB family radical SAM enzyme